MNLKWILIGLLLGIVVAAAVLYSKRPPEVVQSTLPIPGSKASVTTTQLEMPADFQKLLDKEKEIRARQPAGGEAVDEDRSLKIGAALPALKGEWIDAKGAAPELKNKVLLLDFFTTHCVSCVAAIPDNNAIYKKFGPDGLVFAFVSPEPKNVVEEFAANFKSKIEYPVLTNADALFDACGIKETPSTLLFDRGGVLRWKGALLEKDGKLDEAFEKALNEALKK